MLNYNILYCKLQNVFLFFTPGAKGAQSGDNAEDCYTQTR